jgi:hypothetical protein
VTRPTDGDDGSPTRAGSRCRQGQPGSCSGRILIVAPLGAESDWVVPDRAPKAFVVYYTVMHPRKVDVSADSPAPQVDVQALAAETAAFLEQVSVGEGIGAKLSRVLLGFLEAEVVPQATRAADQGIDPTPLFAVVRGVLRLYADALEHPDGAGH